MDSHAGLGLYDLKGDQASRTGEYLEGIARLWDAPDLPTLEEAGIGGIEGSGWIGFVVNAQVPASVQVRLSDALRQAIADPAVQQRLKAQYMEPVGDTPEQFRQYMKEERARWGPLIEQLGLKASN
ncbi:MAG: 23S rRNA (adenine(2030)-N(6))-methyltransferase RlmJ [Comamonadaceae bacterium]|nr:MAG: 23S rRNA (adenine(2030)-N(6))-methyltransferase RlmJ [Comamonadaceae bacterium]